MNNVIPYKKERARGKLSLLVSLVLLSAAAFLSVRIGQFSISFSDFLGALCNVLFAADYAVPEAAQTVLFGSRLPRTIAAFMAGSCLSATGAAVFGVFRSKGSRAFALSGVLVCSLAAAAGGIIKLAVDRNVNAETVAFWTMGSLTGVTYEKIGRTLPAYAVCIVVLLLLNLGQTALRRGGKAGRAHDLLCGAVSFVTLLFAAAAAAVSVGLCGNVVWVGFLVPCVVRAVIGDSGTCLPLSFIYGGIFMMAADTAARVITVNELPLGMIAAVPGAIVCAVALLKCGRESKRQQP